MKGYALKRVAISSLLIFLIAFSFLLLHSKNIRFFLRRQILKDYERASLQVIKRKRRYKREKFNKVITALGGPSFILAFMLLSARQWDNKEKHSAGRIAKSSHWVIK